MKETMRHFLLCQVHGWFNTTTTIERAEELRDEHRNHEHNEHWDGEILITEEK